MGGTQPVRLRARKERAAQQVEVGAVVRKKIEREGMDEFQGGWLAGVVGVLCKDGRKDTGRFVPEAGAAVTLSLK